MKVRQRKQAIYMSHLVRMLLSICHFKPVKASVIGVGGTTLGDPRRIDWAALEQKQSLRSLVEDPTGHFIAEPGSVLVVEDLGEMLLPKKTYTVARKKDGEIIGTFETEEAAQAVIDKAKAAKKAALVLV